MTRKVLLKQTLCGPCRLARMTLLVVALCACSIITSAQTADALLAQGREAFMDYRFAEAARLYGQAKAKAQRADEFFADKYDLYQSQLTRARSFLERVEDIEIIDSISVDRQGFFKAYRLPASAGRLGGAEAMPRELRDSHSPDYVFTNERGNYKMWSEPDSLGYGRLMESTLLTDGTWSEPSPLDEDLADEEDAAFPFMMADGVTLYYASNGENSIGGYDIMVATRDASDGSFMQPSNLGFPYNSPYDDYLLAIDELNGVGWWATDRNGLDDMITVYVFIPRDLRSNYPPDRGDIVSLARLTDYTATQPEDADYSALLATIAAIDTETAEIEKEFEFPAKGTTYYRYDQLPDDKSRAAMRAYQNTAKRLEADERSLLELRKEYHSKRSSQIASQIRQAEIAIETTRTEARRARSNVYNTLPR